MSHDWPRGVYHHGPKGRLMQVKKHFRSEIQNNTLGSRAAEDLLKKLCPKYWFSGHLHVKFPAVIQQKVSYLLCFSYKKAKKFIMSLTLRSVTARVECCKINECVDNDHSVKADVLY